VDSPQLPFIDFIVQQIQNNDPRSSMYLYVIATSDRPIDLQRLRPIMEKLPWKIMLTNPNFTFSEEFVVELQLKGLL